MGSRISKYTNTVWGANDARFRCFYWANLLRGSYVGKVMYRRQCLLLNTLPFVKVVRQSWGWKHKLRWALPCNMCHLKFGNNISIQFGPGASGRILPLVTRFESWSPRIAHARVRLATDTLPHIPHRAGALCTGYALFLFNLGDRTVQRNIQKWNLCNTYWPKASREQFAS
jgi:hypothetical protein